MKQRKMNHHASCGVQSIKKIQQKEIYPKTRKVFEFMWWCQH